MDDKYSLPVMDDTVDFDPRVVRLAEEYATRIKAGESVGVAEYINRHPNLEGQILEVFPAIRAMQQVEQAVHFSTSNRRGTTRTGRLTSPEFERIGDYEIDRAIGRGGMGIVYLARQPKLNRKVAIKILPESLAANQSLCERFQREAQAAARLAHPNIVPVYDFGDATAVTKDGVESRLSFLSMRYVNGISLDKLVWQIRAENVAEEGSHERTSVTSDLRYQITSRSSFDLVNSAPGETCYDNGEPTDTDEVGPLPPMLPDAAQLQLPQGQDRWKFVARIGIHVADALSHAHANDILHRDIKPSNLLIDRDSKVWVADFGLAKIVDSDLTATGGIVGTLRFMPPERFNGWSDPRSDVYSLGMTLYELTTTKSAFPMTDRTELVARIGEGSFPPPRQHASNIPVDLETIILKAVHKEPQNRYGSAELLKEDLQRFSEGRPILARRSTRLERVRSWARRNPMVAFLAASISLLLLTVAAGASLTAWRFNDLATELGKEKDSANRSLLLAYESEAHARTTSRRPGQKLRALEAVTNAIELLPQVKHDEDDILRLRNEAAAALTLTDIEFDREFPIDFHEAMLSPDFRYFGFNDTKALYHLVDAATGNRLWSYQFQDVSQTLTRITSYFSPDSRIVVTHAFPSDGIKVFEVETGRLLLDVELNWCATTSVVAYSANDSRMAVANGTDPIGIYDTRDLSAPPLEIEVPFPVHGLFYSHDESKLYGFNRTSDKGDLLVVDLETLETSVVETGFDAVQWELANNGKSMIIGTTSGETEVTEWPEYENRLYSLSADGDQMAQTALSPDDAYLVTKPWAGNLRLIELNTGNSIFQNWGTFPAFNSTGDQLAINQSNKIRVYRVRRPDEYFKSMRFTRKLNLHSASISPDGRMLAVMADTEMQLIEVESLNVVATRELQDPESELNIGPEVEFLANDRLLVTAEDISIWTIEQTGDEIVLTKGRKLAVPNHHFFWATSSQDTGRITWLAQDGEIKIASIDEPEQTVSIPMRESPAYPYFRLSPDGRILSLSDGTTRLFDAESGKQIHDFGRESAGETRTDSRFSPDGRFMICNSGNEHVLFDLENHQIKQSFPCNGYMCGADWSHDGSLVAMVDDFETIVIRSASDMKEILRLRTPVAQGIQSLRFTPDDRYLFAQISTDQLHRFDVEEIRDELTRLGLGSIE